MQNTPAMCTWHRRANGISKGRVWALTRMQLGSWHRSWRYALYIRSKYVYLAVLLSILAWAEGTPKNMKCRLYGMVCRPVQGPLRHSNCSWIWHVSHSQQKVPVFFSLCFSELTEITSLQNGANLEPIAANLEDIDSGFFTLELSDQMFTSGSGHKGWSTWHACVYPKL